MAAFSGGASLDAIEAVCGPDQRRDVLDGLSSLVDKSLARQTETAAGEPRFTMLETIREYAREQLDATGRSADVCRRHAAWFLELVESSASAVTRGDPRAYLDRLEREHDNLRAAIAWAVGEHDADTGLRFAASAWRFWQMRGFLDEGIRRVETVLALPEAQLPSEHRLGALEAAGGLTYWRADYESAQRYYTEVLDARRAAGDGHAIADAAYNLSFAFAFGNDNSKARELILEAMTLYEAAGDELGYARSQWALSNLEYTLGDLKAARLHAERALPTFDRVGDAFMMGWCLYTIGIADLLEGDLAAAGRRFRRSLAIFHAAGDVTGYTLVLDGLSAATLYAGDRQRAARIAGAVASLERTTGTGLNALNRQFARYDPSPLRTDPDTAQAYAEGEKMNVDEVVAFALQDGVPE
jgi:tetratricopeptide (TPR) repeat protein